MIEVSVIIPFYNTEKYIGRCLKSLVRQKGVDAEFILIDDGSTDGSLEICERFASEDGRFKIIRSEHRGVSHARNLGLDAAAGKYVAFVDSDDKLLKDALKSLFGMAEETGCDCVKFNAKLVHGSKWMKDSFQKHDELVENFTPEDIFRFKDCRPFVWMHFIHRDLIEDVRFKEALAIGEDQEFVIRYMLKANRVLFTSRRLYCHYRTSDTGLEQTICDPDKLCDSNIRLVEEVLSEIQLESSYFAEWIFDTLYTSFMDSQRTEENRKRMRALIQTGSVQQNLSDPNKTSLLENML